MFLSLSKGVDGVEGSTVPDACVQVVWRNMNLKQFVWPRIFWLQHNNAEIGNKNTGKKVSLRNLVMSRHGPYCPCRTSWCWPQTSCATSWGGFDFDGAPTSLPAPSNLAAAEAIFGLALGVAYPTPEPVLLEDSRDRSVARRWSRNGIPT